MAGQLTFDPSGLAMLSTSYGQTAAAQRSQDLAQALAAMRDPAVGVGAPDDPLGDRLAEALIQRKYGPSAQDFAQAAQSAYSGLDQPSGGPLAPFAPATTPDSLWLPSGRGAAAPTIDEPIPAPDAGVPLGRTVGWGRRPAKRGTIWRAGRSGPRGSYSALPQRLRLGFRLRSVSC